MGDTGPDYGALIWSAYAASAVILGLLAWAIAWRNARVRAELSDLEARSGRRRATADTPPPRAIGGSAGDASNGRPPAQSEADHVG